jgi:hypothetical protein
MFMVCFCARDETKFAMCRTILDFTPSAKLLGSLNQSFYGREIRASSHTRKEVGFVGGRVP